MASLLHRTAIATLLRVVLLVAACVRVSALSSVYLACFFALLLLPLEFSKGGYRIVQFLRIYAGLCTLAQLSFQIYLGSQSPYAHNLSLHRALASTLVQIGFTRFDIVWHSVLRFLAPDCTVLVVALAIPRPFNKQAFFAGTAFTPSRLDLLWKGLNDWGVWMLLGSFALTCFNASGPSVVFYAIYLTLIAAFVLSSSKVWVPRCRILLTAALFLYLTATYFFQFPAVYQAIAGTTHHGRAATLGLVEYIEQNPPSFHASPVLYINNLAWPYWLLLASQLVTIFLVVRATTLALFCVHVCECGCVHLCIYV